MRARHVGKNLVIVGALLAVGFLVAWLRFRPHLASGASWTDGVQEYAVQEASGAVRHAVWEAPVPYASGLAGDEVIGRPALSPDGRWIVFGVGARGEGVDLWIADLVAGQPREPRPLTALNSVADDLAPAFGPDGLWFASDRAGGLGGFDLYRAPFQGDGLGAPRLVPGVSSPRDDLDPAPAPAGGVLAFASNRRGAAGLDLFLAQEVDGEALRVTALSSLNTPADDREPAFASDGRTLFLASNRSGGAGGFDLYRSALGSEGWVPAVPLAGINGPADDRSPAPSADGFTLLFGVTTLTEAPDASSMRWRRARSVELFREPGRPIGWVELSLLTVLLLLALLAWLAKRWEQLDVLYKCLLASLVAHVLLVLWFQEVYPERQRLASSEPGVGARVRVRMDADPAGRQAARAERGGAIEVARAGTDDTLTRRDVEAVAVAEGARTEAAVVERAARAAGGPALARVSPPLVTRSTGPDAASTRLADAPETVVLRAGDAPSLIHEARPAEGRESSSGSAGPEAVRSSDGLTLVSAAMEPGVGDRSGRAPRQQQVAGPQRLEVGSALVHRVTPSSAADLRDAPVDSPTLRSGGARGLSLNELTDAAGPERTSGPSPDRADAQGGALVPSDVVPGGEPVAVAGPVATQAPARVSGGADVSRRASVDHGPLVLEDGPAPVRDESRPHPEGPASLTLEGLAASLPPDRAVTNAPAPVRVEVPRAGDPGPEPVGAGPSAVPVPAGGRQLATAAPGRAELLVPEREMLQGADIRLDPEASLAELPVAATEHDPSAPDVLEGLGATSTLTRSGGEAPGPDILAGPRGLELPDLPSGDGPGRLAVVTAERASVTFAPGPAAGTPLDRTPYRARFGAAKLEALQEHGGSVATEAAVAGGLAYLASVQRASGHWGDAEDRHPKYEHVVIGKTGLCLLAFLGAGHWPGSDTEYAEVTGRAIDFLIEVQDERSGHFGNCSAYGHGIATYALAEYHALTRDPRVRPALERAVAWILRQQKTADDPRLRGGWGYYGPTGPMIDRWPRVSVSVWQVMALESATLGGIDVPEDAFDMAREFLRRAWDAEYGAFRYSHDPIRMNGDYPILPGSTPAALFGLSILGDDIGGRSFRAARRFVSQRAPEGYAWRGNDAFVHEGRCNLYFWYYGSLALFRVGGRAWEGWNEALKATLLPEQNADGSWDVRSIYARDYAGDDRRDRSYSTAMAVLTLEVYYRYFTPLLQVR